MNHEKRTTCYRQRKRKSWLDFIMGNWCTYTRFARSLFLTWLHLNKNALGHFKKITESKRNIKI